MNTHSLLLAVLALAAPLTVQAQTAAPSTASGLLGLRFVEASAGAIDPHGTSDVGFAGDLGVNLPVRAGLDLGFGYSYGRINADIGPAPLQLRSRDHTAFSTLTAYTTYGTMKPFGGVALGYQWSRNRLRFGGVNVFNASDDEAVWGAAAGIEIPVGGFTVTPLVTYQDGFDSDSAAGFTYGAELHRWFTSTLGGFAEATFSDPTGGGTQAWIYRAGLRLRF